MTRPRAIRARSNLPVRKQHAGAGMRLGMALVRHAEIGPAHTIPAGHEAAERVGVARLAADRHATDPGTGRGGLRGGDRRLERALIERRELEHAHLVPGTAPG